MTGTTGGPTDGAAAPVRVEVRPADLAALGEAMSQVAADLEWSALAVREGSWALGTGHSSGALADVLGDFEHQRLVLGRALDDLGRRARHAGARYLEVEHQVGVMVDPGGAP